MTPKCRAHSYGWNHTAQTLHYKGNYYDSWVKNTVLKFPVLCPMLMGSSWVIIYQVLDTDDANFFNKPWRLPYLPVPSSFNEKPEHKHTLVLSRLELTLCFSLSTALLQPNLHQNYEGGPISDPLPSSFLWSSGSWRGFVSFLICLENDSIYRAVGVISCLCLPTCLLNSNS